MEIKSNGPCENCSETSESESRRAGKYIEQGLVPIPVASRDKKPLIKWDRYQDEPPKPSTICGWFKKFRNANVGLICGPVGRGFTVLDIDDADTYLKLEAVEKWNERTPVVKTGGGGYHVWLISNKLCHSFSIPSPKIEVKGYGSQVVAPPSIHESGQRYEFVNPDISRIMSVDDAEDYAYGLAEKMGVKYADEGTYVAALQAISAQAHSDPYPIQQMLQGVKAGQRNITAFLLASYFISHRGLEPDDCERRLIEWNNRNEPPLPKSEIKSVVKSVARHGYRVGLRRIHSRCPPEGCPECCRVPRPEDYREADELLRDCALLYCINQSIAERIEGEERNRLLVFLLGLSGKLPAERKAIITVKGEPAGGKSNLVKILTQIYKVKEVGRFSPTAVEYGKIEEYDILVIKELYEEDKTRIRLLSSSDGGYVATVTERDPSSGKFQTRDYHIPPITIFTTTTRIDLDPQFRNRTWEINVDESPTLTERVYGFKERKEDERIRQILTRKTPDNKIRLLKPLVERLQLQEVIIPYSEAFRALLDPTELRSRRDWDKIHDLVYYSAFLHQYQRPQINGAIVATIQDLYYALAVGLETFQRTKKGIEKRIEDAIPTILAFETDFTRKELAERLRKSETHVKGIVKVLKEKALLQVVRYEGKLEHLVVTDAQALSSLSSTSSFESITNQILKKAVLHMRERTSSHSALLDGLKAEYLTLVDPVSGQSIKLGPSVAEIRDDMGSACADTSKSSASIVNVSNAHDDLATTLPLASLQTSSPLDAPADRDRALAKLRMIGGPFSWDYGVEQVMKVTGDHGKAEAYLGRFRDDGLLAAEPDGCWRVTR